MNCENYTSGQKVLAHATACKIDDSGCNIDESVEVLSDIIGTLLGFGAPSKAELTEYLDNKLLPYIRRTTLDLHDIKHLND